MKRFLTLFPALENVHLVKDVGMIPFILNKQGMFECTIASYKNGDYPYLETEVKGLKHIIVEKRFRNTLLNIVFFLLKERKHYDILQVYHLDKYSLIYAAVFTWFRKNKAKTYLKLDANEHFKQRRFGRVKKLLYRFFLKQFSLVSAETKLVRQLVSNTFAIDVKHLPNGFYDNGFRRRVNFSEKENMLLTVGRIGTYVKATDILCEAFTAFAKHQPTWTLVVVGPIETSFKPYLESFLQKHPELIGQIQFVGPVEDRERLEDYYRRAKLFVLPSRWEGFALVYLEAAKAGCFTVTTAIAPAFDVTDNGRLGKIVPVDDAQKLARALDDAVSDENGLQQTCHQVQDFAYQNFYWPVICDQIAAYLPKK